MRKLQYSLNIEQLRRTRREIVPAIFTEHQFELIEKKASGREMTNTEKAEFSRSVSRKMKAINAMIGKESGNIFVYGGDKMIKTRLEKARKHLKELSRKFKNRHIIISGSFLYDEKYNDIDVFVISKYDKDDCNIGEFHINYLSEDAYESVFYESIRKLCISNKEMKKMRIDERINLEPFVYLYQELFSDLDKKFAGIRSTLRDFLLQAELLSKSQISDSFDLRQKINMILGAKKPKEIVKRIFVNTLLLAEDKKEAVKLMKNMIDSYRDIIKEYKQHKSYYLDMIEAFKEVVSIES